MSKLYVFSTLTCDNRYGPWQQGGADLPVRDTTVLVKGGAGVANDRFVTPLGVATEITESQLELLEADPVFALHKKNGFITVQTVASGKPDADDAAIDMASRDKSAPLVPQDFQSGKEDDDTVKVVVDSATTTSTRRRGK